MAQPAFERAPAYVIVAIPVKDEAERIGACVMALNEQRRLPDAVVLLLNNCTDATESTVRALQPTLRFNLNIVTRELPPEQASAGHARRLAMNIAASQAGPNGILMTSDADTVVPPDWIERNLAAVNAGADVVCGRAAIDAREARLIPAHLHADDAREQRLIGLLDDLAWILDPEPNDPPPRHTEASGASMAVRGAAYVRAGGIPAIRSGEDRAFVRELWLIDAAVRHDPSITVMVSGRMSGRAEGGMADAIRRRMIQQDEYTDDQVEPATAAYRRYSLRARARRAWSSGLANPALCRDLKLPPSLVLNALGRPHFGAAWAALEATSPILGRQPVRFAHLPAEIASAQHLLQRLSLADKMAAD